MFENLHPDCECLAIRNPRYVGEDDRVYGVDLVQLDWDDQELESNYVDLTDSGYYQSLAVLQSIITQVNSGRSRYREQT
ncbi:MAG: hypothetical protein WD651_11670 [Acidimicrobiia bacterium]